MKPKFSFDYVAETEIDRLRAHKSARSIPNRSAGKILVATWNIANLGAQQRDDRDFAIMAEILSWYDLVAIQECRDNFGDLFNLVEKLPTTYRVIMSDASGNNERMAYIYNSRKLSVLEEVGEISFPPSDYEDIKLVGVNAKFSGFDRSPYLVSFAAGKTSFTFVNVHLYFGDDTASAIARRSLETYAVAKWCDRRQKSRYSFTRELVALGDFNMPKSQPGDPVFNALTKLGMELPDHSTQIASSISSDSNYDQVAFLPTTTRNCFTGKKGVFDYDSVVFPELWKNGTNATNFRAFLRYHISDHRPMWVQLKCS